MRKKQPILVKDTKAAARVLRALNHDLRRNILVLLERNEKLTVTEIWAALGIEQSVCSNHLAILRRERIVKVEQVYKNRYYCLDRTRLKEINNFCRDIL